MVRLVRPLTALEQFSFSGLGKSGGAATSAAISRAIMAVVLKLDLILSEKWSGWNMAQRCFKENILVVSKWIGCVASEAQGSVRALGPCTDGSHPDRPG